MLAMLTSRRMQKRIRFTTRRLSENNRVYGRSGTETDRGGERERKMIGPFNCIDISNEPTKRIPVHRTGLHCRLGKTVNGGNACSLYVNESGACKCDAIANLQFTMQLQLVTYTCTLHTHTHANKMIAHFIVHCTRGIEARQ